MKAFGEEEFIQLVGQITRLEAIMDQEAEKAGGAYEAPSA